jgi:4-amino-4-deoxy-L-arabinose transferase-like glycosyltransferase
VVSLTAHWLAQEERPELLRAAVGAALAGAFLTRRIVAFRVTAIPRL